MAAATDEELIALADGVSTAMKAVRIASNQYENALSAVVTVTALSIAKRDAVTIAGQNLAIAKTNLEFAIKSRIV